MAEEMDLVSYLKGGGKVTSPENAPSRYRAELMRIMASFVDSELAGAAGFADLINRGPGITERIAAARIVLEKFDHAERILKVMGEFGANIGRYETIHPWNARVERETDLGASRHGNDMRVNVFHYPIEGWLDAVTLNALMGAASVIQVNELSSCSYQPLGAAFAEILPKETRHAELGEEGLKKFAAEGRKIEIATSVEYWRARVAASFGGADSRRFNQLRRFGLRHVSNRALLEIWTTKVDKILQSVL